MGEARRPAPLASQPAPLDTLRRLAVALLTFALLTACGIKRPLTYHLEAPPSQKDSVSSPASETTPATTSPPAGLPSTTPCPRPAWAEAGPDASAAARALQAAYDLEAPGQAQNAAAIQAYADVAREFPGTRQAAYAGWRAETLRGRLTSNPGPAPRQSRERQSPE